MTEQEVKIIFDTNTDTGISGEYTKNDLEKMYETIYDSKPLTKHTKYNIITDIRNYFYVIKRAEAFNR